MKPPDEVPLLSLAEELIAGATGEKQPATIKQGYFTTVPLYPRYLARTGPGSLAKVSLPDGFYLFTVSHTFLLLPFIYELINCK